MTYKLENQWLVRLAIDKEWQSLTLCDSELVWLFSLNDARDSHNLPPAMPNMGLVSNLEYVPSTAVTHKLQAGRKESELKVMAVM